MQAEHVLKHSPSQKLAYTCASGGHPVHCLGPLGNRGILGAFLSRMEPQFPSRGPCLGVVEARMRLSYCSVEGRIAPGSLAVWC